MCSTPPAIPTSYAPIAIDPAIVVIAVSAPAHQRSIEYPGTEFGKPASKVALRPIFIPWSPLCVAAAIATSSISVGAIFGLRSRSPRIARTIKSSARVPAYKLPAFPNGVRTASTKTTDRDI